MTERENDLTNHLIKTIDIKEDELRDQEIKNILHIDEIYRLSFLDTQRIKLHFFYHFTQKITGENSNFSGMLLGYAVRNRVSLASLKLLTETILSSYSESSILENNNAQEKTQLTNNDQLNLEMKQKIFMNALCYAVIANYPEAAEFLLAYTDVNIDGATNGTTFFGKEELTRPLHLALRLNHHDLVKMYLYYADNYTITDGSDKLTYLKLAEQLSDENKNAYKSIILAANDLSLAKKAYNKNDHIKIVTYFSAACDKNADFTLNYLEHHITMCNKNAFSNNTSLKNYGHLLTFIRIFHAIYDCAYPVKNEQLLDHFSNNIVLPLLAHHCGQAFSLFSTEKQRNEFSTKLLSGKKIASRIIEMPGDESSSVNSVAHALAAEKQPTQRDSNSGTQPEKSANSSIVSSNTLFTINPIKRRHSLPAIENKDSSNTGLGNR